MAKITITKDNLLTLAEFRALLEQTETRSSTMDYIFRLLRELVSFEDKYNMAYHGYKTSSSSSLSEKEI